MQLWDLILNDFSIVIYAVDIVLILMMLFWEHSNTKSTIMWIVIMAFLPLLGFLVYLMVGQTFYTKWTFKSKKMTNAKLQKITAIELENSMAELAVRPESKDRIDFARSLSRSGAWMYSGSNHVTLFTDGNEKFTSLLDDIRSAKKHINIEYYILRNDELGN
jgi:cardiolipin synthase A/B